VRARGGRRTADGAVTIESTFELRRAVVAPSAIAALRRFLEVVDRAGAAARVIECRTTGLSP
jgi:hypothetical protein